jgi:DNA polymerase-4
MPQAEAATILHADLDAFYASVEQMLDPTLRGKPIAVGGGVVLAASYEARAFGVGAGISGRRARQLCPRLQFVEGHFSEYSRLGDQVMDIFGDFTPWVERISIDEAFLDVSGTVHLFGAPIHIAAAIRRRVRKELGLPISVGVARTKHLAKVASQVAKPDGLLVVDPEREREFLEPLPVGLIWGVGPVTRDRLENVGIRTIGQLADTSTSSVEALLGRVIGGKLSALATNVDPRRVAPGARVRSVGAQSAMGRSEATSDLLTRTFLFLADRVASRLRAAHRAGHTVSVRVRFPVMQSVTRSITLPVAVSSTNTLAELATGLARNALVDHWQEREVSLLAISVSKLVPEAGPQLELPFGLSDDRRRAGTHIGVARWAADRSIDAIRERFGRAAIGYAATHLDGDSGVPDEFRELAERDIGGSR